MKYIDRHTILTVAILIVVCVLLVAKVDVPDAIWALLAVVSPGLVFKAPEPEKPEAPKIPPLAVLVLALSLPGLTACGGATPPGCDEADLGRMMTAEQGEIAFACAGQGVDCPARDPIHAKWKARREQWFLRCQPGGES